MKRCLFILIESAGSGAVLPPVAKGPIWNSAAKPTAFETNHTIEKAAEGNPAARKRSRGSCGLGRQPLVLAGFDTTHYNEVPCSTITHHHFPVLL